MLNRPAHPSRNCGCSYNRAISLRSHEQATTPRKSTHPRSDFRRAPQVVHHFAGPSSCLSAKSVTALPSLNAAGCIARHSHMQKRAALKGWQPTPRNTAWTLSSRQQRWSSSFSRPKNCRASDPTGSRLHRRWPMVDSVPEIRMGLVPQLSDSTRCTGEGRPQLPEKRSSWTLSRRFCRRVSRSNLSDAGPGSAPCSAAFKSRAGCDAAFSRTLSTLRRACRYRCMRPTDGTVRV